MEQIQQQRGSRHVGDGKVLHQRVAVQYETESRLNTSVRKREDRRVTRVAGASRVMEVRLVRVAGLTRPPPALIEGDVRFIRIVVGRRISAAERLESHVRRIRGRGTWNIRDIHEGVARGDQATANRQRVHQNNSRTNS